MPIIEIRRAEVLREIQDLVWAYSFLVAGRFSVERELFEKEAGNLGEAELGLYTWELSVERQLMR